jgi:hypothetical protein
MHPITLAVPKQITSLGTCSARSGADDPRASEILRESSQAGGELTNMSLRGMYRYKFRRRSMPRILVDGASTPMSTSEVSGVDSLGVWVRPALAQAKGTGSFRLARATGTAAFAESEALET